MRSESSGNIRVLLLLSLCFSPLSRAGLPEWSPERLMQAFAGVDRHQARFIESRELALLQNTLTSEGTLSFTAPDSLVKQYDPPGGQRFEIAGNRLTIRDSDGREKIVLIDNSPQLLAYIASLRAVLAGDLHRLQTYFQLQLSGTADDWLLTLTPTQSHLAKQILRIEISGTRAEILQYVVIEQGGDRILTQLVNEHEK